MIRDIILAFSSAVLLYIGYIVSADFIYGIMTELITELADSYAVSNPTLKTQLEDALSVLKIGYKMAIILLWISICTVLFIVSQRREPRTVYYSY